VEADADKSGLSDYELARLENMKAINEKFNEIFSDVSHLLPTGESETSSAERTPERRNIRKARTGQKGTWTTRRKLEIGPRRNPSRKAHPVCNSTHRPTTRSMSSCSDLLEGLEDDQELKRAVYRSR